MDLSNIETQKPDNRKKTTILLNRIRLHSQRSHIQMHIEKQSTIYKDPSVTARKSVHIVG